MNAQVEAATAWPPMKNRYASVVSGCARGPGGGPRQRLLAAVTRPCDEIMLGLIQPLGATAGMHGAGAEP